jgi:hypothetical protein
VATDEKKGPADLSKKEFEQKQQADAWAQNVPEGGVAEQRPQAFLVNDGPDVSELTQRLKDEGALPGQDEAMDKSSYDRASSEAQMKRAEGSSQREAPHPGSVVEILSGPHRDRVFALVRRISHADAKGTILTAAGSPEQLYSQPKEVELKAVGGDRDGETVILDLTEVDFKKINDATFLGRRSR